VTIRKLRAIMELLVSGGFVGEDDELLLRDQYGSELAATGVEFTDSSAVLTVGMSERQRQINEERAAKYRNDQAIKNLPALEPVQ
jgi:hypothetical protein